MTRPDFSAARWRKSSHSSGQGGECIEMADLAPLVAVRDSKHPNGTKPTFSKTPGSRLRECSRSPPSEPPPARSLT